MNCWNCGKYVEAGSFCSECGHSLRRQKNTRNTPSGLTTRYAKLIFWFGLSYAFFATFYSLNSAVVFGPDIYNESYPYNYWALTIAILLAVLSSVYTYKQDFAKVPWLLFFALFFEFAYRAAGFEFSIPVLSGLADFGEMSRDGLASMALFRVVYHLSIVGILVAFVMSWFLKNIKIDE